MNVKMPNALNGWSGKLLGAVLAVVGMIAVAGLGSGIKTWAQANQNTYGVKECKDDLKAHCDKVNGLPTDIALIKRDIAEIKVDQAETKDNIKDILIELRDK